MVTGIGKTIYYKRKKQFDKNGRNTDDWIDSIRGNHLRKIISHLMENNTVFLF